MNIEDPANIMEFKKFKETLLHNDEEIHSSSVMKIAVYKLACKMQNHSFVFWTCPTWNRVTIIGAWVSDKRFFGFSGHSMGLIYNGLGAD